MCIQISSRTSKNRKDQFSFATLAAKSWRRPLPPTKQTQTFHQRGLNVGNVTNTISALNALHHKRRRTRTKFCGKIAFILPMFLVMSFDLKRLLECSGQCLSATYIGLASDSEPRKIRLSFRGKPTASSAFSSVLLDPIYLRRLGWLLVIVSPSARSIASSGSLWILRVLCSVS
jgi:hypothetical protein